MAIEQTNGQLARTLFVSLLALIVFASNLQAQASDWKTVQNLPSGARIIVKAQHKYSCELQGTTDDELLCAVQKRRSFGTIVVRIPRAEVREVRTLPNQGRSAAIGAGLG